MATMNEGETPTTTSGVVTWTNGTLFAIVHSGRIFEAADPNLIAPVVGDVVLADYLPSSRQWIVVTIVPP